MSYATIAVMAYDAALANRMIACAAVEGKQKPYEYWVSERRWELAATPGWSEAWEYAEAVGKEDIGSDEGVITDGMILAAIQPMDAPSIPDNNLPDDGEPDNTLPEEPPVTPEPEDVPST